jgi:inorganic triphosphatase YgiF
MADYLETERKYEADQSFALPSFAGLPGVAQVDEPRTYLLSATYYDTPDLSLLARKMTLRRRTGGPDEGWHLKLPAGQDTRKEMREPLGDTQVPPRLAAAIGDLTVAPVALLATQRTVRHLYDNTGRLLAEVADDLVTGSKLPDGTAEPLRWREIEVETADTDILDSAGRLLLAAGAQPATSASKVARVLNPES